MTITRTALQSGWRSKRTALSARGRWSCPISDQERLAGF
ncbi:hypothetical protein CK203_035284 [Vitis vinifera]|uniref:Uncharacterized protein n=1 Tax=Vitis vinifera TaxID=29760 RepID=A0A438HN85_VITVI|nr:hypothetical protein CK203_035284 [Vitis vinifera]